MVFFSRVRSTFCLFVQQLELRKFKTLETSDPGQHQKKQHRRPETRKHTKDPPVGFLGVFSLRSFSALCDFFGLHQRVPFICFDLLQQNGCQKVPNGHFFYIFRNCDTVQKSHSKISPFNFFSYFATNWSSKKPKGSPFHNFEP